MSTIECRYCGSAIPAGSRFCSECGRPQEAAPTAESPPREAPRSVWPPEWGLLLVILLAAAGIIALGAQLWLFGILLLLGAAGVYLLQREVERRVASAALGTAWARFSAHRDVVSARSRGQLELFRLRRDLAELQAERSRGFHELGRATYERDEQGAGTARAHLVDVSARIAAKEAEAETLLRATEDRVRRVHAQVAPTEHMEAPPEPARVPEPYPPPGEGTPPEPARVPEPSPEPIPEPYPEPVPEPAPGGPPPEPPQHPPTPQSARGRRRSRAKR